MNLQLLEIKVALVIFRPIEYVYKNIINPGQMSNYFISKSTGRMEFEKTVIWKFPEHDLEFPIKIANIENDKQISFT